MQNSPEDAYLVNMATQVQVLPANYPENIAAVRHRPGMYLGSTGDQGTEHLIYELVSNVLDLYLVQQATFVNIKVAGGAIAVVDDGPGLPFDEPSDMAGLSLATKFLTHMHLTASQDQHAPHVHITNSGVGLAPLNFVAAQFKVQSWRKGLLWEQCFSRGIIQNMPRIIQQGNGRGTAIELLLDPEIFGSAQPRTSVVRRTLFETAHLIRGLKIGFQTEQFHAPLGLQMLGWMLIDAHSSAMNPWTPTDAPPFYIYLQHQNIAIEAAIFGDRPAPKTTTRTLSWVNGASTPDHGSHVAGLWQALQAVNWQPELILLHVVMFDPAFAGPTKSQLHVPHIQAVVQSAVQEPLGQHRRQSTA
jgi:DNA gyrase subunit B